MSETKIPTPEQVRAYVDNGGVRCLFCGHNDIEADSVKHDEFGSWYVVHCDECKARWIDVHRLAAVATFDEDGPYGDTIEPAPPPPPSSLTAPNIKKGIAALVAAGILEETFQLAHAHDDDDRRSRAAKALHGRLYEVYGETPYRTIRDSGVNLMAVIKALRDCKDLVQCSKCARVVPVETAHVVGDDYVGDECGCWEKSQAAIEPPEMTPVLTTIFEALINLDALEKAHALATADGDTVETVSELTELLMEAMSNAQFISSRDAEITFSTIVAALAYYAKDLVTCDCCHNQVPALTAHAHSAGYIGEECWDEILRGSE